MDLRELFSNVGKQEMLSFEQEQALFRTWHTFRDSASATERKAAAEAREKILMAHAPLCLGAVRRLSPNTTVPFDRFQEAFIGMMTALEKFEPERGFRFSTFARWYVNTAVTMDGLTDTTIKRPQGAKAKIFYCNQTRWRKQAVDEVGLEDADSEDAIRDRMVAVANKTHPGHNFTRGEFDYFLKVTAASLDAPATADGETDFYGLIASPDPGPEEIVGEQSERRLHAEFMKAALGVLSERERDVIIRRNLLERKETLDEIAADWGVSKERVRQIECAAKGKMKKAVTSMAGSPNRSNLGLEPV